MKRPLAAVAFIAAALCVVAAAVLFTRYSKATAQA